MRASPMAKSIHILIPHYKLRVALPHCEISHLSTTPRYLIAATSSVVGVGRPLYMYVSLVKQLIYCLLPASHKYFLYMQAFIAEPEMVKLVHFQGYPEQLLPVVVAGIPSMHICLKFIPELVTQPHTQKQVQ